MKKELHWSGSASRVITTLFVIDLRYVMESKIFHSWCSPQTVLIATDFSEPPARTLEVIRQIQATESKILVVHVTRTDSRESADHGRAFLLPKFLRSAPQSRADEMRRTILWADLLSNVVVLKSTPAEEIPALAQSLKVDRVILIRLGDSVARPRVGRSIEQELMASATVSLCIMGRAMGTGLWSRTGIRKVLLPVSLQSNAGLHLRFACRLAQSNHASLTALHVFGGRRTAECPWDRTPVAVEAQLPIEDLKQEGLLCPMEVAVCEGDPGRAILKFDLAKQHDLIILGAPERETPPHIYRNGVVHNVIAEARCPVIVLGRSLDVMSGFVWPVSQPHPGVDQFTA